MPSMEVAVARESLLPGNTVRTAAKVGVTNESIVISIVNMVPHCDDPSGAKVYVVVRIKS